MVLQRVSEGQVIKATTWKSPIFWCLSRQLQRWRWSNRFGKKLQNCLQVELQVDRAALAWCCILSILSLQIWKQWWIFSGKAGSSFAGQCEVGREFKILCRWLLFRIFRFDFLLCGCKWKSFIALLSLFQWLASAVATTIALSTASSPEIRLSSSATRGCSPRACISVKVSANLGMGGRLGGGACTIHVVPVCTAPLP